jgi:hypothetical protein
MSATPRTDALMAQWDDDGATRGAAFIELRDLARELEGQLSDWKDANERLAASRDRWQQAAKEAQRQNTDLLLALQDAWVAGWEAAGERGGPYADEQAAAYAKAHTPTAANAEHHCPAPPVGAGTPEAWAEYNAAPKHLTD